jgi:hypothetical protein
MTAPARDACTLPSEQRPLRAAEFAGFFTTAVRSAQRPSPAKLRLDLAPGQRSAVMAAGLAAKETECCSFFTFTLTATGGALTMEIDVPDEHIALLDALSLLIAV